MGRVTFEGPVKTNRGLEIGNPGSKSNVAGVAVFTGAGTSITLYTPIANMTTVSISGSLTSGAMTVSGAVTITGDVTLASATNNDITINSAISGIGSGSFNTVTLTPGASVTLNCNAHSIFYMTNTSSGGYSLTPVGGYVGQQVTLLWEVGSSSSIVFASSSSLAIRMYGTVTGWAGLVGSYCALHFVNIGPGMETPTTQSVLLQTAADNGNAGSLL